MYPRVNKRAHVGQMSFAIKRPSTCILEIGLQTEGPKGTKCRKKRTFPEKTRMGLGGGSSRHPGTSPSLIEMHVISSRYAENLIVNPSERISVKSPPPSFPVKCKSPYLIYHRNVCTPQRMSREEELSPAHPKCKILCDICFPRTRHSIRLRATFSAAGTRASSRSHPDMCCYPHANDMHNSGDKRFFGRTSCMEKRLEEEDTSFITMLYTRMQSSEYFCISPCSTREYTKETNNRNIH